MIARNLVLSRSFISFSACSAGGVLRAALVRCRRGQTTYVCMCTCVSLALTGRASTIPSDKRGCQSGTWSSGQETIIKISTNLPRDHQTKTRQKRKVKRKASTRNDRWTQRRAGNPQINGYVGADTHERNTKRAPAATHLIPPPDRNYLASSHKGITLPQHRALRVLRLPYRRSRRRLRSSWLGPITAALKSLKLPTTP